MAVTKIITSGNDNCSVDNYKAGSIREMEDYFSVNPPERVHPSFWRGGAYVFIPSCGVSIVDPSGETHYDTHRFGDKKDDFYWLELIDQSARRVMPYLPEDMEEYERVMNVLRRDGNVNFRQARLFYLVPEFKNQGNLTVVSLRGRQQGPNQREKTLVRRILDMIPEINIPVNSPVPIPTGI